MGSDINQLRDPKGRTVTQRKETFEQRKETFEGDAIGANLQKIADVRSRKGI